MARRDAKPDKVTVRVTLPRATVDRLDQLGAAAGDASRVETLERLVAAAPLPGEDALARDLEAHVNASLDQARRRGAAQAFAVRLVDGAHRRAMRRRPPKDR